MKFFLACWILADVILTLLGLVHLAEIETKIGYISRKILDEDNIHHTLH